MQRGSIGSIQHTAYEEIPKERKSDNISSLSFEEFSTGPLGIALHSAYEKAKEALVENKNTQRQIVVVLNKLKLCIDDLQVQSNKIQFSDSDCQEAKFAAKGKEEVKEWENREGGERQGVGEEDTYCKKNATHTLSSDLACAKRDYRLSSKELQLCKLQVLEIQTLKKMTLSALLQAFEAQKCP